MANHSLLRLILKSVQNFLSFFLSWGEYPTSSLDQADGEHPINISFFLFQYDITNMKNLSWFVCL